jgi:hypothetical protein
MVHLKGTVLRNNMVQLKNIVLLKDLFRVKNQPNSHRYSVLAIHLRVLTAQ